MATQIERHSQFTLAQIQQGALLLSLEEREQLTEQVLRSIEEERGDLHAAWLKVAERRLKAFGRGESTAIDNEEVMRMVDRDLDVIDAERKP